MDAVKVSFNMQGVSEATLGVSASPARTGAGARGSSANGVQSGDTRSPESCRDFLTHRILHSEWCCFKALVWGQTCAAAS